MNHFKQIAAKLSEYDLDAMLITSPPGEHYAIGMEGEGVTIVTPAAVHYSTDGRYIEAITESVQGSEISCVGGGKTHLSLAQEFLAAQNIKKLGFEDGYMTVSSHIRWSEGLSDCILTPAQNLLDSLRESKDEDELSHMIAAQKITDETFSAVLNFIKVDKTEQEIAAFLVYEMMSRGATKTSFDPIVASGETGSRPHAIPSNRKIKSGDFITLDFGCMVGGYCSDMTRTIAMGQPSDEMRRVYETVLSAQKAGIAAARAGATGKEVDGAARQVITHAGYGKFFSHSFGHSLGLEIHESPNAAPSNENPLPAGAVISAEPGIYLPGKFGVRIEDVIVITAEGCEILTQSPKNLICL